MTKERDKKKCFVNGSLLRRVSNFVLPITYAHSSFLHSCNWDLNNNKATNSLMTNIALRWIFINDFWKKSIKINYEGKTTNLVMFRSVSKKCNSKNKYKNLNAAKSHPLSLLFTKTTDSTGKWQIHQKAWLLFWFG